MVERSQSADDPRLIITFPVTVPANFSEAEVIRLLEGQGYARIHARNGQVLEVIQDRLRMGNAERARVIHGRMTAAP